MPDVSGPDCHNLTMRVDDLGKVVKVEPGLKHKIGQDWPYRHGPKTFITQSVFTIDFLSKVPATQEGCLMPEPILLDMRPYFLSFITSVTGSLNSGIMISIQLYCIDYSNFPSPFQTDPGLDIRFSLTVSLNFFFSLLFTLLMLTLHSQEWPENLWIQKKRDEPLVDSILMQLNSDTSQQLDLNDILKKGELYSVKNSGAVLVSILLEKKTVESRSSIMGGQSLFL